MTPIEISLAIALIVLAGHSFTWDKHIFSGIRNIIDEKSAISKPLYNCPICMTPWWGTIIYWLIFDGFAAGRTFFDWFVVIGPATGFSVISVVLVVIKDYCAKRTPEDDECCN
jgi:hypothetical protein